MRSKIAVIGEKDSVLGFKAVGFDVYETADSATATAVINRLAEQEYGVIFITEQTLQHVRDVVDQYKEHKIPAIIPIPGRAGALGIGMQNVRKSVERAVGADILFKD